VTQQPELEGLKQPHHGTPHTTPPTLYCQSCKSQAQWLPNGQLWCPQCQRALEVRDRKKQAGATVGSIVTFIVIIALAIAWYQGTFDGFLYQFGLNAQPCAQNFFGTVFCGDDLKEFCEDYYDADVNGDVCDEVLH